MTPPKGRPTRARHEQRRKRVFGSTSQWIALFILLAVLFAILIIVLDDNARVLNGQPAAVVATAVAGGASHPM